MRRLVMAAVATLGAAFLFSQALAAPVNITDPLGPTRKGVATEALYPEAGMVLIQPSFITSRFVYGADGVSAGWTTPKCVTADSTYTLAWTQGFTRLALLLSVAFEDSVGGAAFAIQFRIGGWSASSDTPSTYVVLNRTLSRDTLGSFLGSHYRGSTGANAAWGGSGADTTAQYQGEQPFVLTQQEHGGNAMLPVKTPDGEWLTGPYFGFRWRITNTYFHTTMAAIGNAGKTYGSPPQAGGVCEACGGIPTANPVAWGRWVLVRADLVGWRD